jgi:GR25 family glycosyltransferase involved in LPS biosynthesis
VKPFIPKGVLGCALSHKIAMKEFLDRGENDYMLLLEDDVVMDPNVVENFNLVLNALPNQWDVVKFFGYPSHKTGPLLQKRTVMVDCCAQLIRKSGAKKLTDHKIGYPFYSDTCQWFVPGLQMYTVRSDVKTFYQTFDTTSINTLRYPHRDLNLPIVRLAGVELVSGDIGVAGLLVLLYFTVWRNRAKLIRYANRIGR